MIELSLFDFEQLLVFLKALQDCHFLLKNIPSFVTINGARIPVVNTTHCLELLRSVPGLQGEKFKDNNSLVEYLSKPDNLNRVRGQFTTSQQSELTKVLDKKLTETEEIGEQPGGQGVSGQQEVPVGAATGTSAGGMPGMPSGPSFSPSQRRIIHNIPLGGKAGGTGQGTAATNKIDRFNASNPATAKINRLNQLPVDSVPQEAAQPARGMTSNFPSRKKEKKRWFGRLRPSGSFNPLDLLSKRFANWVYQNAIKPLAQWLGRNVLQPLLRVAAQTASRLLFQLLPRLALGAINALASVLGGLSGISIGALLTAAAPWVIGTIAVVFVAAVIFTAFQGFEEIKFPSPDIPTTISECRFTRGNMIPPAEAYQSSFILDLFQNASTITKIPAEVLAAIARVESPSVTSKTDADFPTLSSIAGCPRSPTGALGIMQIQPPDTTGYFKPGVEYGASFLGKTADQLTEENFCDVRNNIIIAGGFILKKLEASKIGDGTKWDPTWNNDTSVINELAKSYYGCLEYGGPDPLKCEGPYNYGSDLWTSIQSCQASIIPGTIEPPSADLQTLHDNLLTKYNLDFDTNFPYDYLKWAWEKLEESSTTRFLQLVNPNNTTISITRDDTKINAQIGCSKISMRGASISNNQSYPESLFKVVFIHELSHIIENCNLDNISKRTELEKIILPSGIGEGYLTRYSASADQCVQGVNKLNEDYAETIAYFLNKDYPEQSLGIGSACEPPPSSGNPIYDGKHPKHRSFAIDLLIR